MYVFVCVFVSLQFLLMQTFPPPQCVPVGQRWFVLMVSIAFIPRGNPGNFWPQFFCDLGLDPNGSYEGAAEYFPVIIQYSTGQNFPVTKGSFRTQRPNLSWPKIKISRIKTVASRSASMCVLNLPCPLKVFLALFAEPLSLITLLAWCLYVSLLSDFFKFHFSFSCHSFLGFHVPLRWCLHESFNPAPTQNQSGIYMVVRVERARWKVA